MLILWKYLYLTWSLSVTETTPQHLTISVRHNESRTTKTVWESSGRGLPFTTYWNLAWQIFKNHLRGKKMSEVLSAQTRSLVLLQRTQSWTSCVSAVLEACSVFHHRLVAVVGFKSGASTLFPSAFGSHLPGLWWNLRCLHSKKEIVVLSS